MSDNFCPNGHELTIDGACSRDGYVTPDTVIEPTAMVEPEVITEENPEDLGKAQVEAGTPEPSLTGLDETSGLSTETVTTDENSTVETNINTDGNAPPENTCVGCEG